MRSRDFGSAEPAFVCSPVKTCETNNGFDQAHAAELAMQLRRCVSPGAVVRLSEPLAMHTTLRVGGPADIYVEPASEADVGGVLLFCRNHGLRWLVLGRGSNLLVRDGGFRGVVICLAHAAFGRIEVVGQRLVCGAGAKLRSVSETATEHGLAGFEFMDGIPGSVGGALRMNAGAMGTWTLDVTERVRCVGREGRIIEVTRAELVGEYRGCAFFGGHIALSAVFCGQPADPARIAERVRLFRQKRQQTQPVGPSAGCIFKNPPSIPAGKLIEELGLKCARVGGAYVSDKHANFILTGPGATATDVLELIELIKKRARAERGIELEPEVQIVGEDM